MEILFRIGDYLEINLIEIPLNNSTGECQQVCRHN